MTSRDTARAQSEVVGIVLLVAVVVVVVAGAGAILFTDWQSQLESDVRISVQSDVTATGVTFGHMGGDSAEPDEILIVLRGDVDERFQLDDENVTRISGAEDRFAPGSRWQYEFDGERSGVVEVLVVHRPSNTVVHEKTHEI